MIEPSAVARSDHKQIVVNQEEVRSNLSLWRPVSSDDEDKRVRKVILM